MAEFTEAEKRDGFAVRYSPGKGRHLVAARAFAAGEVVLQQEPYAAVLSDEMTPGGRVRGAIGSPVAWCAS